MYRIVITSQARKEIKKIKRIYQEAVITALEDIKENPFLGKPLFRELNGKYSYRVGVYRIIYKINEKEKSIYILSAGHRSTVYI